MRYTKNGGMRFLRLGRLQMSWCVCRASLRSPGHNSDRLGGAAVLAWVVIATMYLAIGLDMAGF